MSKIKNQRTIVGLAVFGVLALMLAAACSTDSPTAPKQVPAPPPGSTPSAQWNISVSVEPNEITAGSDLPATVTVRVRRADNGQPPPSGSTIAISTNLGEFGSPGSGQQAGALTLFSGNGSALLYPGDTAGFAIVTALLEGSAGQGRLSIVQAVEALQASFDFTNSNDNLSVQFRDTSTGGPTSWWWDFGDGQNSSEQHPAHLYAVPGDYVVSLTVSKPGSPDSTATNFVTVDEDPELVLVASFEATVTDRTVQFRDTSTGDPTSWFWDFGDGATSNVQHPKHTYAAYEAYVVVLIVRNSAGEASVSQTVTIEDSAEPPPPGL